MEYAEIAGTSLKPSRVALGTWAIGGWMWGGTDESQSIATIRAAVERGINLIDTAPAYGFGRSEEIVGKAIAEGKLRSHVLLATKVGLEWRDGQVFRNASRGRIRQEIEDSLRRLRTDVIDVYQVHWPDPTVPIEETAEAMAALLKQGKIRAIGVSNFSVAQMNRFRKIAPLHVVQPPYNLFERAIEAGVLPYCRRNNIATFGYGACAGAPLGPDRRDPLRGRRSAPPGSEVPAASLRPLSRRRRAAGSARQAALWQARHPSRFALDPGPGHHRGALGRTDPRSIAAGGGGRGLVARRRRQGGDRQHPERADRRSGGT
jgi:aryl-alcohol dehydrogenase-like predicted oxidoreductase